MAQTQRRTAPQNHGTLSSDLQILLQDFTSEILEQTYLDDCEPDACKKLRNVANNLLCDPKSVRVEALDDVIDSAYKRMSASAGTAQSLPCRRLYTDTSILKALRCASQPEDARQLVSAVTSLDKAIVLAGAPGEGRLDLIQRLIATIQSHLVPVTSSTSSRESMLNFPARPAFIPVSSCTNSVLHLSDPPPLSSFRVKYSQRPFILPGFIKDWPALEEHPWASLSYLRSVAGPGRVVPVEIGSDYRTDDWTQTMMEWDDFLDALRAANISDAQPPLYLAQHNLMAQFPRLRNDVIIPDYVYACPPAPPDYSDYKPPTNDDELVMNVWLGPGGTMSPAHTDPYFNLYAQVVGRKTVWLAPPSATPFMFAYSQTNTESNEPRNPAANKAEASMSNTSRVNVFAAGPKEDASRREHAEFWVNVPDQAMSVTLEPGDLLFFPPGWWHAMRSEETSFSVSMWF